MTRKDFELIAQVFREAYKASQDSESMDGWTVLRLAGQMAAALQADNQRFNSGRFIDACVASASE